MKPSTTVIHKAFLLIFGCLLTLALLELGMRLTAGLISTYQSYRNRQAVSDDGSYRILCLGESTTFFGSYTYAYPAILEQDLNGRGLGRQFRVFNEGRIGTDSDAILEDLPDHLETYRPHMVITMMGINDGIGPDAGRTAQADGISGLRVVRLLAHIRRHLKERLDAAPGHHHLERGYDLLSDGDAEEAWAEVKKAAQAGAPPAEIEALTGHIYWLADGDFERAIIAYETALGHDPNREWIYEDYFQVLYYGQRYADAAQLMRRMLDRFPKSEDAYRKLAKVYLQMKEYVKLKAVIEKAERLVPDDPVMLRIRAAYHLALEEPGEAERYFDLYAAYERQNINPRTAANYRALRDTVLAAGAKLVAVQYPLREIGPLRAMLDNDPRVIYVANEKNFKEAVLANGYGYLFTDQFAGDFGHLSDAGNRLLVQSVAGAIADHFRGR